MIPNHFREAGVIFLIVFFCLTQNVFAEHTINIEASLSIQDTNASNNNKMVEVDVFETKNLNFLFVGIDHETDKFNKDVGAITTYLNEKSL